MSRRDRIIEAAKTLVIHNNKEDKKVRRKEKENKR